MKKNILFLVTALFLTGCSQNAPRPDPVDPVMIKIQDSADQIRRAVIQLEQIKQAKDTVRIKHYRAPTEGPLTQLITFKWSGDAEQAVRAIAEMIGYAVPPSSGTRPTTPVIAVIDTINKPAFTVLEDIGWQVGGAVGISVNNEMRSIMIVYKGEK